MKSPKNMVLALVLSAVVVQSSSAGIFDRFKFQRPEWTKNVVAKVWSKVPKQTPKVIAAEVVATVGGAALIAGLVFAYNKWFSKKNVPKSIFIRDVRDYIQKKPNNNNHINVSSSDGVLSSTSSNDEDDLK